ncbi:heat shock protein grpe [Leishmania mexicana MHOM/GT/2001/U1103]|uniref:Co-chaperone, GrpE n=1 Tax=Leishmania mexicana (strain MHOM/GT/2001/U1103) TaxID=929439 RepID=E9B0J9_LEIMU|nr:heat shock protein grpe [Leishmania mexicana MHOM/GT/2001/U1103]CBZ28754.1 heat shock protein grpe [Leishmania mexicana MHOM/GT/2001/U1103]
MTSWCGTRVLPFGLSLSLPPCVASFFLLQNTPKYLHERMLRRVGAHVTPLLCSHCVGQRKCCTEEKTAGLSVAELKGKYEVLRAELCESKRQIQQLRSENLYAAASCENIRKTTQEQSKQAHNDALRSFARDMLDVCDALRVVTRKVVEYTQGNSFIPKSEASVLAGVMLTEEVALKVLKRYGVTQMHTEVGATFDEEKEEKLFTVPSTPSLKEGSVAEIVKNGYDMNGSVLRRAEVGLSEDP